jgi:hypothetical protein
MLMSPNLLAACTASLLALCAVAGAASATPREDQAPSAGPASQLQQLAHNGDQATDATPQPQHPERFVRIAGFTWSKSVGMMQADLTIQSELPFALKEVEVACAQFARTGVEIDSSRRTIVELVPAHGRLQIEALEIGEIHPDAGSSGCRVVGVTPA